MALDKGVSKSINTAFLQTEIAKPDGGEEPKTPKEGD